MKLTLAAALLGLSAFSLIGCRALVRPQKEQDGATAVGVGDPIVFHRLALPDQDPESNSSLLTLENAIQRALRTGTAVHN